MAGSLYVEEQGKGPVVVLLHGCPTPAEVLRPIADALAATHRTLLVHLPGYGKSAPPELADPLGSAEARLLVALSERGIQSAALVGYSFGAYRALALATSGRLRPTAVICLAGIAGFSPEERAGYQGFAAAIRVGADLHAIMPGRMLSPAHAAAHPEHAAAVSAWLDATPAAVLAAELDAAAAAPDLYLRLASLRVPVTARVGALDQAAPPPHSEAIARAIPGALLEIVPGAGHALLFEDAAGTIASVRATLAR